MAANELNLPIPANLAEQLRQKMPNRACGFCISTIYRAFRQEIDDPACPFPMSF
jgi:hypothetical protein